MYVHLQTGLSMVNSQEAITNQLLADKSDLLMDLPECDSQRLKGHSHKARVSTESAKERLAEADRSVFSAMSCSSRNSGNVGLCHSVCMLYTRYLEFRRLLIHNAIS